MKREYNLSWYHYVPVIIVYSVAILLTIGVFYSFTLDKNKNILLRILLSTIYSFSLIFTIYYHFYSMKKSNIINYDDEFLINSQEKDKDKNFCKICECSRPKRSHHCKICGVCILRMDHHCPWIANCVGEKNEREFIYFIFGCFMTCTLVFFLTVKYFFKYLILNNGIIINNEGNNTNIASNLNDFISSMKFCSCVISFVVGLTSGFIGLNYLFNNIKYNMTCIEMLIYKNYNECPNYNNNLKENLLRKIRPIPFINKYFNECNNISDESNYKAFNEENINLLSKEN